MQRSLRQIELEYGNGERYQLSYEFLRIASPSAEVKGHGPGQAVLQLHKENVLLDSIQPVGNYAVQLFFNDGHDSGIYSWQYLYQLATEKTQRWQAYLDQLAAAGVQRQAAKVSNKVSKKVSNNVVQIFDPEA